MGFFLIKELDRRVVAIELLHLTCSTVRKVWVGGIEQALLSKNLLKSPSLKEEGGILNKIYERSWCSFHDFWRYTVVLCAVRGFVFGTCCVCVCMNGCIHRFGFVHCEIEH